ncbi:hypothetical protein ACLOJK_019719 [Asimina triloba]
MMYNCVNRFKRFYSAFCLLRPEAAHEIQNRLHKSSNPHRQKRPSRKPNKKEKRNPCSPSDSDIVKWNMTISEHMRNGRCQSALEVFDTMPRRSTVSWNALISGYMMNGCVDFAQRFFDGMPERDLVSWNVMLNGYIRNRKLYAARKLFDQMPERDIVSWNTMISGYTQNGYVDQAREIFDRMSVKNSISWNGMLAGYIQNGRFQDAWQLFYSNSYWHIVSWNALMAACVRRKRLADAQLLFDKMPERDLVSWNTLISGYAQEGNMSEAQKLFEQSLKRDVFTWTTMVSGYVQNGMLAEARRVFDEMPEKNSVSWNAIIAGYSQSKMMDAAKDMFVAMPCRDISSWNTMITGYAQTGDVNCARQLFDEMPQRDSISWAAMISGYAQGGFSEEALRLFIQMKREGEQMTRSTFTCALSTCADMAALECGKQVHGRVVKAGYETGCFVGNALLAMYCKCGSIDDAYGAFIRMLEKDVVTWNTMIAGRLDDAQELLRNMPFEPDATMWGALLGASRIHGNTKLGEKAAERIFEMEPENSGMYVLVSNLYAAGGRWSDVGKMRVTMRDRGVKKTPGFSWIEVTNKVHTFSVGDCVHPDREKIYAFLEELYLLIKEAGYVSSTKMVLHDVEEEEKENMLKYHSEKLAVAFGILNVPSGRPIRVIKNLRDADGEIEHMLKNQNEKLAIAFGILNVPLVDLFKQSRTS